MTAASAVMTRTVILCRRSDPLHEVWSVMKERRLKNIPIIEQDVRPPGVLNARDALEALLEEVEYEEVLLREFFDVRWLPLIARGHGAAPACGAAVPAGDL